LTALAAFGLLLLAAASGGLRAQAPYKPQEPTAVLGAYQIDLLGPEGFLRVDGQDHDMDETLALFLPDAGRVLAIYADPGAWKAFYNEIYGETPGDLTLYATVTAAAEAEEAARQLSAAKLEKFFDAIPEVNPDERIRAESETTSRLLEPGQTARSPFELLEQGRRFLTFRTELGLLQPDKTPGRLTFRRRYTLFLSALLVETRALFLNLYQGEDGSSSEEALRLARDWRDLYLKRTAHPLPAPVRGEEPEAGDAAAGPAATPIVPAVVPKPGAATVLEPPSE
jgi:hypothetical protein